MELTYNPIFQQFSSPHDPPPPDDGDNRPLDDLELNSISIYRDHPQFLFQNEDDENNENQDVEDEDVQEINESMSYISRRLSKSRSNSFPNENNNRMHRRNSETMETAMNIAQTIREESMNFIHRRREEVDTRILNIPLQEIQQMKLLVKDTILGQRKFHIAWTCWVVGFSLFGAMLISIFGKHSFVDSWFTAASAICNAGLNVVSSEYQPRSCLVVIALLMIIGGSSVMLLPTMIGRVIRLKKYRNLMKDCLVTIQSSPSSLSFHQIENIINESTANEHANHNASQATPADIKNCLIIIADYYKLYDALLAAVWIVFLYTFLWILFGAIFLYCGLLLRPLEPVLEARGITHLENAIFLSISSFTNSGLTISPNSLFYVTDNDFVLFISSVLILVGNTLMPVLLRYFISFQLWCIQTLILTSPSSPSYVSSVTSPPHSPIPTSESPIFPLTPSPAASPLQNTIQYIHHRVRYIGVDWHRISDALEYILANPRRICTHLFTHKDCIYLLQFAIVCNAIEYFFFIITCMPRPAVEKYGSVGKLLKLGLFQTLNTRHSGFAVFDLRTFPQDMLFVMALSMFLSSIPYISLLGNTATEGKNLPPCPLNYLWAVPKDINKKMVVEDHRRALLSKFSSKISPENHENGTSSRAHGIGFVVKRIMLRVWFLRSDSAPLPSSH